MVKNGKKFITAIDIGTTKICTIIAKYNMDNAVDILGIGTSKSQGIKKGMIIDIEKVTESIHESVHKAEKTAKVIVDSAYIGISGGQIASTSGYGGVTVASPHKGITTSDLARCIETSKYILIPQDREILDVIPQEYIVDGQRGITAPLGMVSRKLEVKNQIITGASSLLQNITKCISKLNIIIDKMFVAAFASGYAALTQDEKEVGVVLIDIGAGTTSIAVFKDSIIKYIKTLPIGSWHIDNDIAIGLSTSLKEAERLKTCYGQALIDGSSTGIPVSLQLVGRESFTQIPQHLLSEIIQPRVVEIFNFVVEEIEEFLSFGFAPAGAVLTGGGSLLNGIGEVASKVLDTNVRLGYPTGINIGAEKILSPIYSAAVGLIKYGLEKENHYYEITNRKKVNVGYIYDRAKDFIKNAFYL